jgi:5-methylcytosine-specific restriction protein A
MQQPLCEMCQQKGIVTLATEVHHIRPISTEYRPDDLRRLALDPYNLMSLCRKCHEEIHRQLRKKGL